jgi:hypothetical protein
MNLIRRFCIWILEDSLLHQTRFPFEFVLCLQRFQDICNAGLQHHPGLHDLVDDSVYLVAQQPRRANTKTHAAAVSGHTCTLVQPTNRAHLVHVKHKVQLAHILEAPIQGLDEHLDQV